jgi:hypothetical protein
VSTGVCRLSRSAPLHSTSSQLRVSAGYSELGTCCVCDTRFRILCVWLSRGRDVALVDRGKIRVSYLCLLLLCATGLTESLLSRLDRHTHVHAHVHDMCMCMCMSPHADAPHARAQSENHPAADHERTRLINTTQHIEVPPPVRAKASQGGPARTGRPHQLVTGHLPFYTRPRPPPGQRPDFTATGTLAAHDSMLQAANSAAPSSNPA